MLPDLRKFAGIPALATLLAGVQRAGAGKFHFVFGSHMVLPREKPVPVWGESLLGENLTVTCAGQTRTAKGDAAGKWRGSSLPCP